jgi:type IV pilus assembly protein PilA
MENPYAQPAVPADATPEQRKRADYELAIGKNTEFYLPKFEHYDEGGSKAGWNWPAFVVTSGWYLYRKMWLWGLLNFFFPVIASLVVGAVAALTRMPPLATGLLYIGALILNWALLTIFANALYWRHVNALIRNVPRSIADKPDRRMRRLERDGGTSIGAALGVMLGLGVVGTGIVAAISIPAYQDYTIRAQVTEGLQLASSAKAAVAEYYAKNEEWPLDASAAGVSPVSGKYVESVTVANGSVVITFGGRANAKIVNEQLILAPGLTPGGDVAWICGEHGRPSTEGVEVVTRGPGPSGSNIAPKYLPHYCRP